MKELTSNNFSGPSVFLTDFCIILDSIISIVIYPVFIYEKYFSCHLTELILITKTMYLHQNVKERTMRKSRGTGKSVLTFKIT